MEGVGEHAISRLGDGTGLMARCARLAIIGTGLRRLAFFVVVVVVLLLLGSLLLRRAAAARLSVVARTSSRDSPASAVAVSTSAVASAASACLMAPVALRKRFTSVVVCRWKASTWPFVDV
jgi:hypothetical protein